MRIRRFPLLAALIGAVLAATPGPLRAEDGDILSRAPYRPPDLAYADWFDRVWNTPPRNPRDPPPDPVRGAAYFTPALFAGLSDGREVGIERITYESDGLAIAGFIVRPAAPSDTPRPVIVWCRGGNRDFGAVNLIALQIMTNWARQGFVVVASNYRGGPGSEGRDEFGGADVNDVMALAPLIRRLPGADADRIFLYGESRGGVMVYRALAEGFPARAAALNSGATDLGGSERGDMHAVYRELMPDYEAEVAAGFCRRSAVCWPERIARPVLILAATGDWRVSAEEQVALAERLQALGRPVSLRLVEGGSHIWLDQDQAATDAAILAWFRRHDGV